MLNSLKSVHETLSQERQKLQEVWETNNVHQPNTLAEVGHSEPLVNVVLPGFLDGHVSLLIPVSSSLKP